jgi:hypothetical protein
MASNRANQPCTSCGERREQGSSPYIKKTALLINGDDIVIEGVDPDNGRRFWGTKDNQQYWFTLKDIRGLKG